MGNIAVERYSGWTGTGRDLSTTDAGNGFTIARFEHAAPATSLCLVLLALGNSVVTREKRRATPSLRALDLCVLTPAGGVGRWRAL